MHKIKNKDLTPFFPDPFLSVDKATLSGKCGRLSAHTMRSVDEGLRLVLSL